MSSTPWKNKNPPIHIYISIISNRLVFNIKDGYKLDFQTPEFMKLFGSTKKLIEKAKNRENVLKWLNITCNLVDNQYQQKSEMFFALNS